MGAKLIITNEMLDELALVINKNKERKGALMPILQGAQRIFGCVPIQIQKLISKELAISVAEVNGVVTFYAQFSIEPKGKNIVGICLGTACYVRGAQDLIDAVKQELRINPGETSEDGLYTLEATRCIGACGLAPVLVVNEHVIGNASASKAVQAVKDYAKA